MSYFHDLELIAGRHQPACRQVLHWRWDEHIALQFCSGGGMYFAKEGRPPARIERPALFWTVPGITYAYGPLDRRGWAHHWVTMRGERIERLVRDLLDPGAPDGWRPVRSADAVAACFRVLIGAAIRQRPSDVAAAAVELEQLALVLNAEDDPGENDPHRDDLIALAERVRARPALDWDWAVEAGRLGWTPAHLRRRFAAVHGHPPHRFLIRARLEQAMAMLQGRRPAVLADIANACGFGSARRLHYAFSARYGMPPGQLRSRI